MDAASSIGETSLAGREGLVHQEGATLLGFLRNHRRCVRSVIVLVAMALAAVGFGHRPLHLTFEPLFDIAAYTLPDGTVPVLCLNGKGTAPGTDDGKAHAGATCDACLIVHSFVIPERNCDAIANEFAHHNPPQPVSIRTRQAKRRYATSARSPPPSVPVTV